MIPRAASAAIMNHYGQVKTKEMAKGPKDVSGSTLMREHDGPGYQSRRQLTAYQEIYISPE